MVVGKVKMKGHSSRQRIVEQLHSAWQQLAISHKSITYACLNL